MSEPTLDTSTADPPLSSVVRDTLERSGELNKIRAMIQAKVLEIVRGCENTPITKPPDNDKGSPRDILNKLILEYFHWSGFIYSADMLASESGTDHQPPSRLNLENFVGDHEKDSPILLSLVDGIMKNTSDSQ